MFTNVTVFGSKDDSFNRTGNLIKSNAKCVREERTSLFTLRTISLAYNSTGALSLPRAKYQKRCCRERLVIKIIF